MTLTIIKQQIKAYKSYLIPLALYTFLFLFFCSKLSPLYPTNEWGDVNVYFNVGKGIFSGMTLYSEVFDHKGPLIFFLYGFGSLLSGSLFIGVFLLFLLLWVTAMFAAFFTAKLFVKERTAFLLTLLLPLAFRTCMFEGGSAEELILLFNVISLYFFTAYYTQSDAKHKPYYMFVHGVLSSAAFMIKLNLIVFWFFPLLFIFIRLLCNKEYKNFLLNCLAYLGGFAAVMLPICLYFLANGALGEAYKVYIELNSMYGASGDYVYMIGHGFRKLYTQYKAELIWYLIATLGFAYFPFRYLKNKLGAISILLAGISLILTIFFPLTFHLYYPLPFFAFAGLGLVVVFGFLEKYVTINWTKKLMYLSAAVLLLFSINKVDFFGLGGANLLRMEDSNGPQFAFKKYLDAEENPTLLNLAFSEGNALFTTTGITPTVRYFFSPNIYYEMYPDIRDSQERYIENKETMFIISSNVGFNTEHFKDFEPLQRNYTLIETLDMGNKSFYLYKRND